MNETIGEIMTLKQIADYLKVHPQTIYRLLQKERLPAFRLGGDWRFQRSDVDAWIQQQQATSFTQPVCGQAGSVTKKAKAPQQALISVY